MLNKPIYLASKSPRRKELLSLIEPDFFVIAPCIEEKTEKTLPQDIVLDLSIKKATAAIPLAPSSAIIIASDTIVVADEKPLGKPKDKEEAYAMLKALSGTTHAVYTGITLLAAPEGIRLSDYSKTLVTFAVLSDEEILSYIDTGDPMDKAGAYGIQSGAAKFVEKIEGCYFNVMGLPVRKTYQMLQTMKTLLL